LPKGRCYLHSARDSNPCRRALPRLYRSYWLMRRTYILSQPRFYPCTMSLCRLLRAPAGSSSFPTLFLRIFLYVQGPLPRRLLWCTHPFLPTRHRPSRRCHPVGAFARIHALATSAWATFRGCSHSLIFKPVDLLATQIAPTATLFGIR
jgi:hypothetical protein